MTTPNDKMLKELHEAIIGTPTNPGILELLRDHERRISRIEMLGTNALKMVWAPIWAAISGGIVTWLAMHGIGKVK
jgi:hypothetical protein